MSRLKLKIEEISFSTPEKTKLFYALKKLSQKERELVHLYYYEEYSIREIAEIMGMSETAIQTRLYRARINRQRLLSIATMKEILFKY